MLSMNDTVAKLRLFGFLKGSACQQLAFQQQASGFGFRVLGFWQPRLMLCFPRSWTGLLVSSFREQPQPDFQTLPPVFLSVQVLPWPLPAAGKPRYLQPSEM